MTAPVLAYRCLVCRGVAKRLWRGACYSCAIDRYNAAVEFIHAADAVRLLTEMGAKVSAERYRPPSSRHPLIRAMDRLHLADEGCIRLGMWSGTRSTRRSPWHYGDERSNTR